jgi:hypothetical protein
MPTTRTSCRFSATHKARFADQRNELRNASCLDEVEKIAEDAIKKNPRWKKALKSGATYALGYAAGHGAAALIDKGLSTALKSKYPQMSPAFKQRVLYPLLGVSMVGLMAAQNYANTRQQKMVESDE